MPQQPIASISTRKIRVENVSWEVLRDLDAEPHDNGSADRRLIGDLQAEFLLSLLTPSQQEVTQLLMTGLRPIEVAARRGVSRLQICRMRKRIKARLAPHLDQRFTQMP